MRHCRTNEFSTSAPVSLGVQEFCFLHLMIADDYNAILSPTQHNCKHYQEQIKIRPTLKLLGKVLH